jgi:hypothetical protein
MQHCLLLCYLHLNPTWIDNEAISSVFLRIRLSTTRSGFSSGPAVFRNRRFARLSVGARGYRDSLPCAYKIENIEHAVILSRRARNHSSKQSDLARCDPDFDDCHVEALCVLLQTSLSVRVNMLESNNGLDPALVPAQRKPKRHNAKLCSLANRERIVTALANGDSQRAIARSLRVSPNTVTAVAEEEWKRVETRKARIAAQSERNATRAAELIAEKLECGNVPLNVLVPVFGVSVDKAIALRSEPITPLELHSHQHLHAHLPPLNADTLAEIRRRLSGEETHTRQSTAPRMIRAGA